jgi:hypothetical protein
MAAKAAMSAICILWFQAAIGSDAFTAFVPRHLPARIAIAETLGS